MRRHIKRAVMLGTVAMFFLSSANGASARPAIAAGNLTGCLSGALTDPGPQMRNLHAKILRVVVSSAHGDDGEALPCIRGARSDGYRTELVVQWNSSWSLSRTKSFFQQVLKQYRYYSWAIGIGNEQEITPRLSSAGYSRAWHAVEPIVRRMAPWAVRVGGEISPWGLSFLHTALRDGLPGIQAIAVHPYAYRWAFSVSQALRLARSYRLPLWCDEALYDGRTTWHARQTRWLSAMRGAALVGVWVN